jgi:cell division protein FtsA
MDDFYLGGDSSQFNVLSNREREPEVIVINIRNAMTDIAVFHNGRIYAIGVLPMGSESITRDIQIIWKTPFREAEKLKKEWGTVLPETLKSDEMVDVPCVLPGRKPQQRSRRELAEIIKARVEEILMLARSKLERHCSLNNLKAGIVLTGDLSRLTGIHQLAEQIFGIRCCIKL